MRKDQSLSEIFFEINRYAMHYGLLLGAFWLVRYLFLIVADAGVSDRFAYIFYLLNIVTLLIVYAFYYKFKTSRTGALRGVWECVLFTVMMCFYASFLEGAIMFAHYQFIDPAYFNRMVEPVMRTLEATPKMGFQDKDYEYAKEITAAILSNKLTYIVTEFVKNILLGFFLGFILNFVVKINRKS
jgi:hypothetical protein